MPTNEGFCFFNENGRPAIICLTSATPKNVKTCEVCGTPDSWLVAELFHPSRDEGIIQISHTHVWPDRDLTKLVQGFGVEPVYMKTGGDVERWLWQFYLDNSRLRRSRNWITWVRELATTEEPLRTYEMMTHCAMEHPRAYNVYYSIYQRVVAGRKYLLFE